MTVMAVETQAPATPRLGVDAIAGFVLAHDPR